MTFDNWPRWPSVTRTDMAKRFGLWQYHRAATAVRKEWPELKWWEYEVRASQRFQGCMGRVMGGRWFGAATHPYRPTDAITHCAYRYMRMYKRPMRVREYKAIVRRICRSREFHHTSETAALKCVQGERPNALMRLYGEELNVDWQREQAIEARLESIKAARKRRIEREEQERRAKTWPRWLNDSLDEEFFKDAFGDEYKYWNKYFFRYEWRVPTSFFTWLQHCARCEKVIGGKYVAPHLGFDVSRKEDRELNIEGPLCWACYNKLKPIVKAHKEFNETRLLLNRLTKEVKNARKQRHQNHGATARVSGDDDGGGEERRLGH